MRVGDRVRLIKAVRRPDFRPGLEGTIALFDEDGRVHVDWDDGRMLGLIRGEDEFEVIK